LRRLPPRNPRTAAIGNVPENFVESSDAAQIAARPKCLIS